MDTQWTYIYRFQNIFLRCPTPRLQCFLSSHWPSFRFLPFMAFLISSIQFFFGLPWPWVFMYLKSESVSYCSIQDVILLISVWCWMQQYSTVHVNVLIYLYMKVSSRSIRIYQNLKEYDNNALPSPIKDIRKLMVNMKLLLICILRILLSHFFIFFRFYFLSVYIWFYSCLLM